MFCAAIDSFGKHIKKNEYWYDREKKNLTCVSRLTGIYYEKLASKAFKVEKLIITGGYDDKKSKRAIKNIYLIFMVLINNPSRAPVK